ncbi:hypothetical protein Tco_0921847, partial [Tanacetum coccineum]
DQFDTSVGNPVKEILLKLNLPDHRIFKDGGKVKSRLRTRIPSRPVWGCDRLVSRAKVMAISVISVSSDSSEESVGTSAGRAILFGTILTTIPDTTPTISPPTTHTDTTVTPT